MTTELSYPLISCAGENAIIIYFGKSINESILNRVDNAHRLIQQQLGELIIDLIPSYRSILVIYDLHKILQADLELKVRDCLSNLNSIGLTDSPSSRLIELPVYYGRDVGLDLEAVSQKLSLEVETIISIHQERHYRVYALGFAPGFAYLGVVDSRIQVPRLDTPRLEVPKGSVAITDDQTGVYPSKSPGGWNLIGNCPRHLIGTDTRGKTDSVTLAIGDRVQFYAIDRAKFIAMGGSL